MSVAFTRQLGAESGVQLNPLRDNSEIPVQDNSDQIFGIMMRAARGRTDKPFKVNRGNITRKLGRVQPIAAADTNAAYVHVHEALNNGAYEAVVMRLLSSANEAYTKKIIAVQQIVTTTPGSPPTVASAITYSLVPNVDDAEALADFVLSIDHVENFNDGIKVSLWADEKFDALGDNIANTEITLEIYDVDDELLFQFKGSTVPGALDDSGNSYYLPDVIAQQTDLVVVTVAASMAIRPDSNAYGYTLAKKRKLGSSAALAYFVEAANPAYSASDISNARVALQYTEHNYAYISSGESKSSLMLAALAQLAFDTNRQLRADVPGDLSVDAAIAWVEQLNLSNQNNAHLIHWFWMPVKSNDPTGINGNIYLGGATLNIAYACGRNAQTNAKGFAPKNFPIAGRNWNVSRSNMRQMLTITDFDKDALARAKINPIIFETYTGGSRCVFFDSLTSAKVESSLKKLIAVADMSTTIDDAVTRFGKDVLQLPMDLGVKRMKNFLTGLFENAEASGWLVPSDDPAMNGSSWKHDVRPNELRPYDRMDVSYWLRYDGTIRQIFVTQTLSR